MDAGVKADPSVATREPRGSFQGRRAAGVVALLVGAVAVVGLSSVIAVRIVAEETMSRIANHTEDLVDATRLQVQAERLTAAARGYVLFASPASLDRAQAAGAHFGSIVERLRGRMTPEDGDDIELLDDIERTGTQYGDGIAKALDARTRGERDRALDILDDQSPPLRDAMLQALERFRELEERKLEGGEHLAGIFAQKMLGAVSAVAAVALLFSVGLAAFLRRSVRSLAAKQREIDAYVDTLQRANADLDAFAGRVAHDLRNALGPLTLIGARLGRGSLGADAQLRVGQQLTRSARRTSRLIDSLLAFSRAGRASDRGDSSTRAVVDEVMEDLRSSATDADVTLEADVDDLQVACAPGLLYAVVANVAGNAVKYTAGCPKRVVRVAVHPAGDLCSIVVSDSGPGIPADARARVFEPFYRVERATAGGAGIGLATVRRIVDAHGGTVDVDSEVGHGATFTVRLPLSRAEPVEAHA